MRNKNIVFVNSSIIAWSLEEPDKLCKHSYELITTTIWKCSICGDSYLAPGHNRNT